MGHIVILRSLGDAGADLGFSRVRVELILNFFVEYLEDFFLIDRPNWFSERSQNTK